MAGFTKLFASITDSTIWQAPNATRIVWITMLAMADQNGYVGASVPGLASRARVTMDDCLAALTTLLSPDEWSRTKDFEGRRIAEADGGWTLLNHAKYRAKLNAVDRREQSRVGMAKIRAERKQELTVSKVNSGEHRLTQAEAEAEAETIPLAPTVLVPGGDAKLPQCPYEVIVSAYHEVLPTLNRCEVLSDFRKGLMRSRWREVVSDQKLDAAGGIAWFRWFFETVGKSKFLMGKAKGDRPFKADLEWLVRPQNFVKVFEGKYV